MILILGVALASFCVWILYYGWNVEFRWKLRKLPGPPPSWLLGNMREFGSKGPGQSHIILSEWRKKYGPIYCYFLGRVPYVVISDPALIKEVTTRRSMQFHDRGDVISSQGNAKIVEFEHRGLLFARGKVWKGLRSTCEAVFSKANLEQYAPLIANCADRMVYLVNNQADNDTGVDISNTMAGMTMDVIGKTAFGVNFKAQSGETADVVMYARSIFRPFGGMNPTVAKLCFIAPFAKNFWSEIGKLFSSESIQAVSDAFTYIWGVSFTLLNNARVADGEASLKPPLSDRAFQKAHEKYKAEVPPADSIIQSLRKAVNKETGEPLSEMDISAQSFTALVAGYETTSTSLSYTLYCIARYPEVQRKIIEEIDGFGKKEIGYGDLEYFKYTKATFEESLRMFPPVSCIVALKREAGPGAQIGEFAIPETTRVQMNIYDMHHNQAYFPSPEQFLPERFLEDHPDHETYKPRDKYAYIPFGCGSHKCVGYKFAEEEAIFALVKFMQRFEIRLDPEHHKGDLHLLNAITLVPKGGIWLKVHRRE